MQELTLQRLFSTFANGLPGLGLLLQRILSASILVSGAVMHSHVQLQLWSFGPPVFDAVAGMLILFGLWTPVVGAMVAGRELWIVFAGDGELWLHLILATLGASLAMIGPGAWSIDARLFGRRQFKSPR